MLYIMLGVIIFLLTILAVGSLVFGDTGGNEGGNAGFVFGVSLVVGTLILLVLGGIYFFFL